MLFRSALLGLGATLVAALDPLDSKDSFFVNSKTGDQFKIVGVAYQPGGSAGFNPASGVDPLSNATSCMRDAAIMQIMGFNLIRVYNVDPDVNHDECASIFDAAGIYMAIDVNSPLVGQNLPSIEPWTGYYAGYINHTCAVVEAFKSYNNTALFFSGNEVIDNVATGQYAPAYIRAITRDLRTYIKNHSSRHIPVGYSAADVRSVLVDTFNYLTCSLDGTNDDLTRSELFALNSYSWCGNSTFDQAGYNTLVSDFAQSTVPVFFSEYGCNAVLPRVFTEVQALYGPQMTELSGGVVYEYIEEVNNYGLVNVSSDGSAQLRQDFENLKAQYALLNFTELEAAPPPNTPAATIQKCAAGLISTTGFESNFSVPATPTDAVSILKNGVNPAPVGKMVTISDYTVQDAVYNVDGSRISGLAVKPVSEADAPGINPASTATGTASASTPTSSHKSIAARSLSGGESFGLVMIALSSAAIASFLF